MNIREVNLENANAIKFDVEAPMCRDGGVAEESLRPKQDLVYCGVDLLGHCLVCWQLELSLKPDGLDVSYIATRWAGISK